MGNDTSRSPTEASPPGVPADDGFREPLTSLSHWIEGPTWRSILDTIPFPFFAKDAALRYTACNLAFEEFLGLPRSQIIGHGVSDIAPREKAEVYDQADRELLEKGGRQTYETTVRFADGTDRPVLFHKSVVEGSDGRPTGIVGIYIDITERKRAEKEALEKEAHLARAGKMEALGQLAGGIAHDFNNIVGVILNYVDLLSEQIDDPSMAADLDEVREAGRRAAHLTRHLLVFGRKGATSPQLLRLDRFVSTMRSLLARSLGEQIELVLGPHVEVWPVEIDPTQLHQLVLNLALNARDAMPRGGTFTLTLANVPGEDADGGQVMLSISDTGTGMSKEVLERIFEPFFTTKEIGRGTGLGLSSVFGIVQRAGGRVEVESELGRGSTFRVLLPRALGEPTAAGEVELRDQKLFADKTILLVEDEAGLRLSGERLLLAAGYRVIVAQTGADALALFRVDTKRIDLVVTDVVMPGMSGPDLVRALHSIRSGLPAILMSGHDDDPTLGSSTEAQPVLRKPLAGEELLRTVEVAFTRAAARREIEVRGRALA